MASPTYILGIPFFRGTTAEAARVGGQGGLVVFPAAPALKEITRDSAYRAALLHASLVAADSAFMVLCWRAMGRGSVSRISGLAYLRELLARELREPGEAFWVMASDADAQRNSAWLQEQGIALRAEDLYVAPVYGTPVGDDALLAKLEASRPRHILLTVGGGTQEKLGDFLLQRLGYQPAIHCVGAAIAFLSGSQVHIPVWADRFYLGWLLRVIAEPRRFGRRYWEAVPLLQLLWRYGAKLPPMEGGAEAASFPAGPGSWQA